MILCRKNFMLLLVVLSTSACGMMGDDDQMALQQQRSDWFEYAYYSSAATLENDGLTRGTSGSGKPARLY